MLKVQFLRSTPDQLNQKLWGWAPSTSIQQVLQAGIRAPATRIPFAKNNDDKTFTWKKNILKSSWSKRWDPKCPDVGWQSTRGRQRRIWHSQDTHGRKRWEEKGARRRGTGKVVRSRALRCSPIPWFPRNLQQSPLNTNATKRRAECSKPHQTEFQPVYQTRCPPPSSWITGEEAGAGKGRSRARGSTVGFHIQVCPDPKSFSTVPQLSEAKANCWINTFNFLKREGEKRR